MAEELNKGVSIPMVNIGTSIDKGMNSRVPLDTPNNIVTLTKTTNISNNRDFRSALELSDYNIKVNDSADKVRDSEVQSNSSGTHYDRKLTLRDLGRYMTDRIKESIGEDETYNINLRGKFSIGSPSSYTIIDAFKYYNENWVTPSKLNGSKKLKDDESGDFNKPDSKSSMANGYIGSFDSISRDDFISKYCDSQSGIAMGDAKVINPDFQFNELDDMRTDFRRPKIGRLYAERIYDYNLPTVYFCPGKVEIKVNTLQILSTFTRADSASLTNYIKDAGNNHIANGIAKMGGVLRQGVGFGAKKILDKAQWYSWTPLTTKYMKYMNEMLIELAVWMGLIDSDSELLIGWQNELQSFIDAENNKSDDEKAINTATNKLKESWSKLVNKKSKNKVAIDKRTGVMVVNGYLGSAMSTENQGVLSVLTILPQYARNNWVKTGKVDLNNTENFTNGDNIGEPDSNNLQPEELFIPFGMCKGVNVSESFSNSTGEHPLTNEYNTLYEDAHTSNLTTGMNTSTIVSGATKAADIMGGFDTDKSFGENALSLAGNVASTYGNKLLNGASNSEIGMVTTGAGRFVLPETWTNSTFDRSYNITFKFRSPYGHRLSIFENTMVPLLFLISMTAPRAVGLSSYTNPFYIKAFSKGLFSCDLGMITSLSISRGEDKNDRTVEGFFRTVTASVSIKDMLPTMQLGLGLGKWDITNAANNGMTAYMCNLAGVGFVERANLSRNFKFLTNRLKTEIDEFGATTRAWMMGKVGGANILGLGAKQFGKVTDPTKDRRYHSDYN